MAETRRIPIRRIMILLLSLVGGYLVVTGVQHWLDRRAATQVLNEFLTAVRDGDRETALAHLEAERRAEVESELQTSGDGTWTPMAGIAWRINELELGEADGYAKLFVEKDGFIVEPIVHLVRTSTSSWKIDRIEQLAVDPRWQALRRDAARKQGDETAHELEKALRGQPGIEVRRLKSRDE